MRSLRWGIGGLGIAIAAFACSTSDREPPGGGLPMPPAAAGPGAGERSVPISGGTLLVLDSARVLASDPDRDRLVFASITGGGPHAVALEAGDEPGRAAVAPDGTVAVALRGADALLFTTSSGSILARVPTCRAPRGVAFDAADGAFHVACADGDLWSFDAGSHAPVRKLRVAEDLRDVIATGDRLLVSTFRSAEVFAVSRDGVVTGASRAASAGAEMVPTVAWRMQPLPGGGALMVHQSATSASIEIAPPTEGFDSPAYGGDLGSDDCEGAILVSATSVFDAEGNRVTAEGLARLGSLGLPVDIAVCP